MIDQDLADKVEVQPPLVVFGSCLCFVPSHGDGAVTWAVTGAVAVTGAGARVGAGAGAGNGAGTHPVAALWVWV
jgi:hypothetical protein